MSFRSSVLICQTEKRMKNWSTMRTLISLWRGGRTNALKSVRRTSFIYIFELRANTFYFISMSEHKKSTVLSEVGFQVWRGAFLLNDFILSHREIFSNKNVIELGSGVGLTSILASIYARKVICTGLLLEDLFYAFNDQLQNLQTLTLTEY